MRRTKILYLIGTLEIGGAERQLVELVRRLDPERFEPVVCCLTSSGPLQSVLDRSGIPVVVAGYKGFDRSAPRPLWRLLQVMRAEAPDIVHAFLYWAYVMGAFAARAARVPVVIASRRSLSKLNPRGPHHLLLVRLANRMTDLVIANSEAVREDTIAEERLPPERVITLHNGLDISRFRQPALPGMRASLGVHEAAPVVAVVANLHHYKGHTCFLEAWMRVVARFPSAVALLVGDGAERPRLEQIVSEAGLSSNVRFLGSRLDVPEILAVSDLLVHPSLQEGFCNVILEAMAAGKVVVATDVGGNAEAVVDGRTGLLVPAGDAARLADAMLRLLYDPEERRRFGEAGYARAAELFTLEAMVERYESVYDRMTKRVTRGQCTPAA